MLDGVSNVGEPEGCSTVFQMWASPKDARRCLKCGRVQRMLNRVSNLGESEGCSTVDDVIRDARSTNRRIAIVIKMDN